MGANEAASAPSLGLVKRDGFRHSSLTQRSAQGYQTLMYLMLHNTWQKWAHISHTHTCQIFLF